ncbi:glycosyltransferase 87 family protein [Nocardia arthritidis]|uniref:DUF2029 domain-containing protein n=1 Tax=Nocardia arthritidis TaxID=228602 RepID=A0A6G9YI76_9NOCA|nr:glycosyltransferase 87 family protein [Nocardia arthritidis]QIS13005.1 DUF2029 domain-containing protein [Nocardia arthritidis]
MNRRFGPVVWLIPAVLVVVSAVYQYVPLWPLNSITGDFIDLQVYRLGVEALWHGRDMYGTLPPTTLGIGLPFIYPPFAALALGPYAFLPWGIAKVAFFITSVLGLALTLYLVARRVWSGESARRTALLVGACALPLAMLLEPVHQTLDFGQVNIIAMALVAADCLTEKPRWRRGILVGVAAAIKLTPAAFVLYFLVRREYKAAATAAVSGAVATLLAFAVLPAASVRYWFGGMGNLSGLSGSAFRTNQSIQGMLTRLGFTKPTSTLIWLAIGVVLLLLVATAMRRAAAMPALAFAFNAVFTLLLSPISWSHHWVWIAPALLAMVGYATRLPSRQAIGWYVTSAVTAAIFVYGPQDWLPGDDKRELAWTPWQHVIGNTYVWFSVLLVLLYLAASRRLPSATEAVAETREPSLTGS